LSAGWVVLKRMVAGQRAVVREVTDAQTRSSLRYGFAAVREARLCLAVELLNICGAMPLASSPAAEAGVVDDFGAAFEVEFLHGVGFVGFDGFDADGKLVGDLFVGIPVRDQRKHLDLALR
jgi:hypothetical protein